MKNIFLALGLIGACSICPTGLRAEGPGFGLRFAGGYGFSLNTITQINSNPSNPVSSYPASPGIPASLEVLYYPSSAIEFSLGIFPEFMTRTYQFAVYNLQTFQLVQVNRTDSATFLPVLFNVDLKQNLGSNFKILEGVGIGVAPATTFTTSYDQGVPGSSNQLDAAMALRAMIGVEMAVNQWMSIGLLGQGLFFDQHPIYQGGFLGGWSTITQDFNQIAPMLFADANF